MFIEITALFSIFHLIIAENSTSLMLADSMSFAVKISDEEMIKSLLQRLELLQTVNENIRLRLTSLDVAFNELLAKQRKELKEEMKKLKEALTKQNKPSTPVDPQTETANGTNGDITDDHCASQPVYTSCEVALSNGTSNGVYRIKVPGSNLPPFFIYCLKNNSDDTDAWMVIQRRMDGSIDFFRKWVEYQNGFGHLEGEYFIGLDKLHAITASTLYELWIQMEDFEDGKRSVRYSHFAIGGKDDNYTLNILGSFSGEGNDSLRPHAGHKFSTKDRDNDVDKRHCANSYYGAWWYGHCHECCFNGRYIKGKSEYGHGIIWGGWRGWYYSLKYVHMAIRPVLDIENCT